MSKYKPLENHLKSLNFGEIPMTFEEIETLLGHNLPPSARKHRPWWSNNPSNSAITHSWLAAGYKTARVDMGGQRLVFVRTGTGTGNASETSSPVSENRAAGHPVLGCMTATVTMPEDIDLTEPAMSEWTDMTRQGGTMS